MQELFDYYIMEWKTTVGLGVAKLYQNPDILVGEVSVNSLESLAALHTLLSSNNENTFNTATGVLGFGQLIPGEGIKVHK